jgi:hypothetical protein
MRAGRDVARAGVGGGGPFGGADLADAIEVGVVVLMRKILAHGAVAEGHVLAPEKRGGREE